MFVLLSYLLVGVSVFGPHVAGPKDLLRVGLPLLRVRASPGTVVLITGGRFLYAPTFVPTADRSMSSSLSASQLHTVNMRDPLNRVLGAPSHPGS